MTQDLIFERSKINGMDVLLAPRPGLGLVAVAAMIHRGSADESDGEHGLASFTTSMLMRGTTRRGSEQLAFDLESIGAIASEGDGKDACSLGLRSGAGEAAQALEIMFEALRQPAFDPREHEINRQEVLADLRMQEDEKFGFTYREYLKAMFAGHGYGHQTEGEQADVEAITPEACRRWHAEAIGPGSILLVAVGDLDVEAWRGLLERLTDGWASSGALRGRIAVPPGPRSEPLLDLAKPGLSQGFVVVGYRAPPITDAQYPALRLASAALGEGFAGRMFSNLRDRRSLAYALGASLRPYRLGGHQLLYIGTQPERIEEAREGLLEEAEAIRRDLLTEDELNRAREYILGKYVMGRQSVAQRVGHLAWWEDAAGYAALGAAYPDRLRAVTAPQIREAAHQWWREPTIAILRPGD